MISKSVEFSENQVRYIVQRLALMVCIYRFFTLSVGSDLGMFEPYFVKGLFVMRGNIPAIGVVNLGSGGA